LCTSWHVVVLTGDGHLVTEFSVSDGDQKPQPVTPRLVGDAVRALGDRWRSRVEEERARTVRRAPARTSPRQRHRH
jgi:hypothetical protein